MRVLKVKITPVGIDENNPTRFDLCFDGIPGSMFGYTKTLSQAQSWEAGVMIAIKKQHELSFNLGLKDKNDMR